MCNKSGLSRLDQHRWREKVSTYLVLNYEGKTHKIIVEQHMNKNSMIL